MILNEISDVGKRVLQEKQAAIIGLSIRNKYFRGGTIERITSWAKDNFDTLIFMLPDEPSIDTLCGLGYNQQQAKQKAVSACNNLENKCQRIISKLSIINKSRIVRWAELENNLPYQATYCSLSKLYDEDELFKHDIRQTTKQVMSSHQTSLPIEMAIDIGIQFLIKELSFIIAASDILNLAYASAYLYHRPLLVHQNLLAGRYKTKPPANSGYIICEVDSTSVGQKYNQSLV